MDLITTMGGLHILSCDGFDCNKKVETHNEMTAKDVARLSGWKNKGDQWMCPTCGKRGETSNRLRITPKSLSSMGIVSNAWAKFGYVKCDGPNCNKKLDVSDLKMLEQVALLSGWKNRGDRWICPICAEKDEALRKSTRAKKPTKRPESTL